MKIMNVYILAAVMLLSLKSIAQKVTNENRAANNAWIELEAINNTGYGDFIQIQTRCLKYRQEGMKFWKMFPNDPRKYKWLLNTIDGEGIYYWKSKDADAFYKSNYGKKIKYSWPLNKKLLLEWEKVFPQFKKEFLSYYTKNSQLDFQGDIEPSIKLSLLTKELSEFLALSLNEQYRGSEKIDINKLKLLFIATGPYLINQKYEKANNKQKSVFGPMSYSFLDRHKEYGMNTKDLQIFFNSIRKSSYPALINWAVQKSNLYELIENPLSLKHTSIDNKMIDLSSMKGKVVLVDFWSTWCTTCIYRMPAIKRVYDKYKNQGFEVVSVCINPEEDILKIKSIEKKIGADWPILMIGSPSTKNSLGQQIWMKYGFWGVPQLLLLNKEGRLVMLNDKLQNGDFEPDVKELLAADYK